VVARARIATGDGAVVNETELEYPMRDPALLKRKKKKTRGVDEPRQERSLSKRAIVKKVRKRKL
jgi:hypothetical protein